MNTILLVISIRKWHGNLLVKLFEVSTTKRVSNCSLSIQGVNLTCKSLPNILCSNSVLIICLNQLDICLQLVFFLIYSQGGLILFTEKKMNHDYTIKIE